jgi:hypothetical protein
LSTGVPPPPQFPGAAYPPYIRPDAPGATASMVLGIVALAGLPLICCCGLGEFIVLPLGIIAVVLGVQARTRVAAAQGALGGDGKALAGIVMGATAGGIGLLLLVLYALGTIASGGGMFNSFSIPSPSG